MKKYFIIVFWKR